MSKRRVFFLVAFCQIGLIGWVLIVSPAEANFRRMAGAMLLVISGACLAESKP